MPASAISTKELAEMSKAASDEVRKAEVYTTLVDLHYVKSLKKKAAAAAARRKSERFVREGDKKVYALLKLAETNGANVATALLYKMAKRNTPKGRRQRGSVKSAALSGGSGVLTGLLVYLEALKR